jgi:hypothetical protein
MEPLQQRAMEIMALSKERFESEKNSSIADALSYALFLILVFAGGNATVLIIAMHSFNSIAASFITSYLLMFFGVAIFGAWLHLWAHVFGAQRGFEQTLKAAFYGSTPAYLFGWMPIIGVLAFFWSLVPQWKGLRTFQEMSGFRAALAVVTAAIIVAAIYVNIYSRMNRFDMFLP